MKVTKDYLKQIIKEELERYEEETSMEEGAIGDFFTKARQTVFGKNAEEKAKERIEKTKEFAIVKQRAEKGNLDAGTRDRWIKAVKAGEWDKYTPVLEANKETRLAARKYWEELLRDFTNQSYKAHDKNVAREKEQYARAAKEREAERKRQADRESYQKYSDEMDRRSAALAAEKKRGEEAEASHKLYQQRLQGAKEKYGSFSDRMGDDELVASKGYLSEPENYKAPNVRSYR